MECDKQFRISCHSLSSYHMRNVHTEILQKPNLSGDRVKLFSRALGL